MRLDIGGTYKGFDAMLDGVPIDKKIVWDCKVVVLIMGLGAG